MSIFGKQLRRLRNPTLPEQTRLTAFVVALDAFAWRTGQDANAVLDRVGAPLGLSATYRPSLEQALRAATILERERNVYIEHERGFARRRVREKARGQRQVSEADRQRWSAREGFVAVRSVVRQAWGVPQGRSQAPYS